MMVVMSVAWISASFCLIPYSTHGTTGGVHGIWLVANN